MKPQFTEKESLQIIHQMVNTTRQNLKQSAPVYLMWGWLVVTCSTVHYLGQYVFELPNAFAIWPLLMTAGGIATPILLSKLKTKDTFSYSDRMMQHIYTGIIAPLAFAILIGITRGWELAFPLFMLIYGYCSILAAGALRFKPLLVGGVLGCIIALVSIFLPYSLQIIAISLCVISAYIIPGYLLKKA